MNITVHVLPDLKPLHDAVIVTVPLESFTLRSVRSRHGGEHWGAARYRQSTAVASLRKRNVPHIILYIPFPDLPSVRGGAPTLL